MRVLIQLVAIAAVSAVGSTAACAYGPTGHRIVGAVAESHLCAESAAAVAALLEGESLAEAGLWADRIRGDPAWRHAAPWHYVNVADAGPIEQASGGDRGDVLQAIARFHAELADPAVSDPHRAEALRFLVHFVADLHQPLHVGRAADRGGNKIPVELDDGKRSNLHALWDAQVLLKADRRAQGYRVPGQTDAIRALTAPETAALQRGIPLDWARESLYLRPYVYRSVPPPGGGTFRPDSVYLAAAGAISMRRLSEAGVRLAGMLNALYCEAPDTR